MKTVVPTALFVFATSACLACSRIPFDLTGGRSDRGPPAVNTTLQDHPWIPGSWSLVGPNVGGASWRPYVLFGSIAFLFLGMALLHRHDLRERRSLQEQQQLHERRMSALLERGGASKVQERLRRQEAEREQFTKDLQARMDGIVVVIKDRFNTLEERLGSMEAQRLDRRKRVLHLLDDAVAEMRRVSYDLVRGVIAQFGLESALQDLRSAIETPGRLKVELNTFGSIDRLGTKLEVAVYHIVREMVSNALRHSRPDRLSIQLTRRTALLNLIVEDNGRMGGDIIVEGMGDIRARAAEFNGLVHVDSRPGRGTSISIDIPLG